MRPARRRLEGALARQGIQLLQECGRRQEPEHESGTEQGSPPIAIGDYVELFNLQNTELNGEPGTARQILDTGRISVELGVRKKSRRVSIKPTNRRIIASFAMVNDVKKRRDKGAVVTALVLRDIP